MRDSILAGILSAVLLACGTAAKPDAAGAGGGASGGAAGSGGSSNPACEPDDGITEPACGALGCNGKCFPMDGACKAGCERVGPARNTSGVLFEGSYAYHFNSGTLDRIDLIRHESMRLATAQTGSVPSFTRVVVVDGVVYWQGDHTLERVEAGGTPTAFATTPSTSYGYIAELDGVVYLQSGLTEWIAIPLAAPSVMALQTPGFQKVPYLLAYDDQYLYLPGPLGANNTDSHTFRATNANPTTPEQLCDDLTTVGGRIYGDYLYLTVPNSSPTLYRRCPKTGGTFTDFLTVAVAFKSEVSKGDALYGLDDLGNVHRIRSSTDDVVIARVDPMHANRVVTDGTSVYVATGNNVDGALFRIIE